MEQIVSRTRQALAETVTAIQSGAASVEDYAKAAERIANDDKCFGQELSDHLGLQFAPRVDGEGAFYAEYRKGDDASVMVYVYPPKQWWNGDYPPEYGDLMLHETLWQMTVGGVLASQAEVITGLTLELHA